MDNTKEEGLGNKLDKLTETLNKFLGDQSTEQFEKEVPVEQDIEKNRKFKHKGIPWGARMKLKAKTLVKKNAVLVFYIRENRTMELRVMPIIEETLKFENDKEYRVTSQNVLLYRGKIPCVIIPEWEIEALTMDKLYDENRAKQVDQVITKRLLIKNQVKEQTKLRGGIIIWIILGIAVVVLGYLSLSKKFGR